MQRGAIFLVNPFVSIQFFHHSNVNQVENDKFSDLSGEPIVNKEVDKKRCGFHKDTSAVSAG